MKSSTGFGPTGALADNLRPVPKRFSGFRISRLQIRLENVLVQETPHSENLGPSTFLLSLHGCRQSVLLSPCGFGTYCRKRTSGILDSSGWLVAQRGPEGWSLLYSSGTKRTRRAQDFRRGIPRWRTSGDGPGTEGVRRHAP